ncbi:MAG: acyl-CoA dehydrogenase N-terminal domain-containing protein, partial [Alphaproteobacteria bacterium]|nr:acyl-CoA dehydrogenase N-terminal domain-containing protein [Alphaproteobacteria bacterium]
MTFYNPPVEDFEFILNKVLKLDRYSNLEGFEEASPDLISAILEESGKLASEVFHPINQSGDMEGCHWENGKVTTPKGFKEAYDAYVEGGWQGLTADPQYGGQGLPAVLGLCVSEMLIAANWGLS